MSQKFNAKFEDEKYDTELPRAQAEQTEFPDVWLKLTAYKQGQWAAKGGQEQQRVGKDIQKSKYTITP